MIFVQSGCFMFGEARLLTCRGKWVVVWAFAVFVILLSPASSPAQTGVQTNRKTESLEFTCDIQNSIDVYSRSLSASRAARDLPGERQSLANLCFLHSVIGENESALAECTQALKLATSGNDARAEAIALNGFGELYYSNDNLQKAIDSHSRANDIWRRLGDQRGQARSLKYLGFAYAILGEIGKAFDAYKQSLAMWRTAGDTRGEIGTLVAMGFLNARIGETQESLNLYYRAMVLNQSGPCSNLEGVLFSGLGYAYNDLGEKQRSLRYYEQAFSSYRSEGDKWGEGAVKLSMGMVYYSLGKYDQAQSNYRESLATYQKLERTRTVSLLLREIGLVYDKRGDYVAALDYYRQSLALTDPEKDPRESAYTLDYIGRIQERSGENQKALENYERALKLNRAVQDQYGETMTLFGLARIHNELGEFKSARTYIESALKISEMVRSKLANQDLRASYFASVRDQFELYTEVLMRLHDKLPLGGYDVVAFEVSERARARSLLETLSESKTDIRQGVDEALLKSERELFHEVNARAERRVQLVVARSAPSELAAVEKELEALTIQHQQVLGQIRASSPRYAELVQPSPLTAETIQRDVLDPNTVLLEYLLGEQRSWLWVVTTNSLKTFALPPRSEIETGVRRFYTLLTERNRTIPNETSKERSTRWAAADAEYKDAAGNLSRIILGPAAGDLGSKRLVIVADGALHYLPFSALPDPAAASATAPPLIVNHELVSLPSASALARMREELHGRPSAPKAVVVLADPVFDKVDTRVAMVQPGSRSRQGKRQQNESDLLAQRALRSFVESGGEPFARLPFSRREGKAIIDMAPKGEALLALDFAANRNTAIGGELAKYRIVHLATHGILNSEYPELSGIVLSLIDQRGREQDGFLDLNEIYNLKLSADLVVLSACQTALGKDIRGEGLVGLTRGFMYAGAPRVVASLWQVDDAATADLMREFYKAMFSESMRPAEALRTAQVRTWERNPQLSPYFWAAFTLQGEWR